jgi:VIT1/CCC1 family predicted Fe2+/Mn2+ transporter
MKSLHRSIELELARKVAGQLMAKDALGAHARDELGISDFSTVRPVQAALTSAATFSVGAAIPLLIALISPADRLVWMVMIASLACLALLGAVGARRGSEHPQWHGASLLLGSVCYGRHGRDRKAVRGSGVAGALQSQYRQSH